ncbi:hypothetical protein JMJ35_000535 [Cladonia borealis]|uniref:MARVEL domain-containing protein n=1 Tax=Cladonia borealis TaxID=184061 RepID=A0AA39VA36_9LECA|nr:hypothetical protein JMJ35_000535 [Cladonia borealis]
MARATVITNIIERKRTYQWPEAQLNFWLIIMLAASATITGIFAYFLSVQNQFRVSSPWLFPYSVATGSLGILFILIILGLIAQRQLLPGIVMLGSFILFVLFLTGLIETSIQLYGPTGSVNSYCNIYTPSTGYTSGQGQATLAYLETQGICNDWKAVFSFYIVGSVFLLWMMVMSYQVNRDDFE